MLHVYPAVPSSDLAAANVGRRSGRLARGFAVGTERPDDHRAEALWKTAPWLAGLSVGCAMIVLWSLASSVAPLLLGGWAALTIMTNIVVVRARRRATGYDGARWMRSAHWVVFEAALHAGLWATLPAFVFAGQPMGTQILLGGALGTMMAGAFLLALVPLAATLWAMVIAGALIWGVYGAGDQALAGLAILLVAYLGVILTGCLTVERLLSRHMDAASDERARREAIGLLLKEYEEQGAGWLWQIDAHNLFTYVSPRISALLGRATSQLLGQSLPVVLGCDARLGGALVAREAFAGLEVRVTTVGGERWMSLSGSPIIGASGTFEGFRGVGSDITDARRSQERLTHMASVDVLTGLPNRQRMRELFADSIAEAERSSRPCAVLFLDLDGFKPVNDSFGHSLGDAVLRVVAQRLASVIGTRGLVGRVGGDEFAIALIDGQSRQAVEQLGQALIRAVAEPCAIESVEIRIGVSIGCAFAPIDGNSVDELLLKADLALYQAKSKGRGTFVHFDAKMQRAAEDRVKLEHDLRQAVRLEQLSLHYQPIVSAKTQAVVGFEALLRWRHPERGMVPPMEFVSIAEENGMIAEIGEWVIKRACADAARWPDHIFVSVNLSPRQLVLPALPNTVSEALAQSRLQPGRLELEVTESVFMSDTDGSLDVLRRVRSIGVGIALDDFGTGYSSLGYLNKTIFHTLKIDGSFVRDAAVKSETVSIIRAIVALAESFRMTIVAEGVETAADFERMQELGCHKIQGYLFGRPVPFDDTLRLLGTQWDYGRQRA